MPRKPLPSIHPRTPAPAAPRRDHAALERFVSGSSSSPAADPPTPKPRAPKTPKVRTTTYTRAGDGAQLARVTIYLPKADHRALKVRCADEGQAISDVVAGLVAGWLHGKTAAPT